MLLNLLDLKGHLSPALLSAYSYSSDNTSSESESEMEQITHENQLAKINSTTTKAVHCPLKSGIRKLLITELSKFITQRNITKWLSTTYDSTDERSQYLTAEYIVDSLTQPALFSKVLKRIPNNAIIIEVSI